MKKIVSNILMFLVLILVGCTEIDNYDEPQETFRGKIIDSTTKENFLCEQGLVQIRLEELSWSEKPDYQSIPSKPDGTFQDTKLFEGHYRVFPYDGPFWPADSVEIDIKGVTQHDFEITPYLKITNVEYKLDGTTLHFKCKLAAPKTEDRGKKLPRILDIRAFINITQFVGNGATISDYSNESEIKIEKEWSDEIGNTVYEGKMSNLLSGRTFYVRVGARVDDTFRKYNYSEVVEIKVP